MPRRLIKSSTVLLVLVGLLTLVVWCALFVTVQQQNYPPEASQKTAESSLDALAADAEGQKLQVHLEKSRRRVKELEEQIAELQGQECRQGQTQSEDKQQPFIHSNPVCRVLPHPIPHPSALWTLYLPEIHKASQLSNDHRYYFHDFTAQLLRLVSPRLPQSVKTLPRASWPKVDDILRVAHERYDYITNRQAWKGQTPPRPVKVVIMGGSLLVGMNCRKIIRDLGFQLRMPVGDCSWSNRLEKVLNQFLLAGRGDGKLLSWREEKREKQLDTHYIVQVTKIAMGGTNTQTGTTILEYDLIPPQAKNPDIIINAYATNDLHVITMLEAQSSNATLRDKIFDMTQDFVRRVMDNSDGCQGQASSPPLLIHLDDYLGNEQREIYSTTELSQSVQLLAAYYGFASASYGDLVRDIVYGDTREYWFSPEGWYDEATTTEMVREIHPNMGMHIVAAWVMAYNFLHIMTTFCSLEGFNIQHKSGNGSLPMEYESTRLNNLPVLNGRFWPKGKPKAPPAELPPPLTKTLSLEHVSELWQQSAQQSSLQQKDCGNVMKNGEGEGIKCPFSWLSGISNEITKPEEVEAYFQRKTQLHTGDWTFDDDHGKLGIVAHSVMNPLTLELARVTQSVRRVTIFFMKSYGPKWANSQVQVQVWKKSLQADSMGGDWELLQQSEFVGYHDKHTSETYTELLDIGQTPIEAGASLQLRLSLVGGSTFKIMGVAICS